MLDRDVTIYIKDKPVTLDAVRAWERKDALRACRKLGVKPQGQSLAELKAQLAARRTELGHAGIRTRLGRELALSDRFTRLLARLAKGRRTNCTIDITCQRGSAAAFVGWFHDLTLHNREDVMVAALPQHYLIATDAEGRQEVIETNGGSPLAAQFFIDYEDLSSLTTPPDPAFPLEAAGVARTPDGSAIGGVRHMFRDESDGFRARLIVEFPSWTPPTIIAGHRWHLACEWSNWIAAWQAEGGADEV